MREIRPTVKDGQTRKKKVKRAVASKVEELLVRDLEPINPPTIVLKVSQAMSSVQVRSHNSSNSRNRLMLHKCPIQRHSYLSNLEQNLLEEVPEDSLV